MTGQFGLLSPAARRHAPVAARCIDRGESHRIGQTVEGMLRLRMFGIVASYEVANECNRDDPVSRWR
jgi:hypothetical protein